MRRLKYFVGDCFIQSNLKTYNMSIKYFLVACFLFFSGNVFSYACDVDEDHIYNVFKEYRISLYDELVNPVSWFSGEFNK